MKTLTLALAALLTSSTSLAAPVICIGVNDSNQQVGFGYFAMFKGVVLLHSAPGTKLQVYVQDLITEPVLQPAQNPEQVDYQSVTKVSASNGGVRATLVRPADATAPATYTETVIATGATTSVEVTCK